MSDADTYVPPARFRPLPPGDALQLGPSHALATARDAWRMARLQYAGDGWGAADMYISVLEDALGELYTTVEEMAWTAQVASGKAKAAGVMVDL